MTWILVGGFTQTLLYNLDVNVTTDWANAVWTVSFLAAIIVLLVYVAGKIAAAPTTGPPESVE